MRFAEQCLLYGSETALAYKGAEVPNGYEASLILVAYIVYAALLVLLII